MSKKFWQTEKFKLIERAWYEKLKEAGFNDVENKGGNLKQNAANSYRTVIQTTIEGKLRYFELLGQCFHDEEFEREIERAIMELHSQGSTIQEIIVELKRKGFRRGLYRGTISKIIRGFERKWQIKKT